MKNSTLILDKDKLLFRRQFILGPYFVERFKTWKKCKINGAIFLTVHPDLQLSQTTYKGKSLTLLGYILDPDNPEYNDLNIIDRLIRQAETADDTISHTHRMGGRWILVLDEGKETRLFNDATGCRQVFYATDFSLGIWCASQPGIIAEELNLEMDEDAVANFIHSPACKHRDYWWPGNSSPFKQIRHLSPNYYLNLVTGVCHRYWPSSALTHVSLDESVERSCQILKGLIEGASNRFNLAMPLTAGWDSRLILAATRDISQSIFYYTLLYWELTDESADISIPSQLLAQLGLKHHVIRCPSQMSNGFRKVYKRNVITAHDGWGAIAQGIYEQYPQNSVCIKANVGEIGRCYYRLAFFERLNAEKLARLTMMGNNSFAIKYFHQWLSETTEIAARSNIDILDLFYWEQRTGNWYAMSQLEWDIAQEVFTPFNCRSLLANLLSVEKKYRIPPDCELFKKLIIRLWPEVLTLPINPMPFGLRSTVKRLLLRARIYSFSRRAFVDIRKRRGKAY